MSEIKFHKANALPSPISQAHDGVWLIADGANNYKHYIITGGVVKELIVEGEDLTLEQARQNGNVLEGDVEMLPNTSLFVGEDSEQGATHYLRFIDDLDGNSISLETKSNVITITGEGIGFGSIASNYNNPERNIGFYLVPGDDSTPLAQVILNMDASTKGLVGTNEFDKQGDRKAFAQIADVEDAMPDYSSLTNQRHIKKVGSNLEDSNIQDTAVGSEVLGRLDSTATVERRTKTSTSSLYTIDLSNPSGHYDLELSGNTSINFSNMIGENQSTVITLVVNGNFSLLFPSWLKPLPNNDAYYSFSRSDLNLITIIIRHGGSSPSGLYSLTNVDIS